MTRYISNWLHFPPRLILRLIFEYIPSGGIQAKYMKSTFSCHLPAKAMILPCGNKDITHTLLVWVCCNKNHNDKNCYDDDADNDDNNFNCNVGNTFITMMKMMMMMMMMMMMI